MNPDIITKKSLHYKNTPTFLQNLRIQMRIGATLAISGIILFTTPCTPRRGKICISIILHPRTADGSHRRKRKKRGAVTQAPALDRAHLVYTHMHACAIYLGAVYAIRVTYRYFCRFKSISRGTVAAAAARNRRCVSHSPWPVVHAHMRKCPRRSEVVTSEKYRTLRRRVIFRFIFARARARRASSRPSALSFSGFFFLLLSWVYKYARVVDGVWLFLGDLEVQCVYCVSLLIVSYFKGIFRYYYLLFTMKG